MTDATSKIAVELRAAYSRGRNQGYESGFADGRESVIEDDDALARARAEGVEQGRREAMQAIERCIYKTHPLYAKLAAAIRQEPTDG